MKTPKPHIWMMHRNLELINFTDQSTEIDRTRLIHGRIAKDTEDLLLGGLHTRVFAQVSISEDQWSHRWEISHKTTTLERFVAFDRFTND